MSPAVVVGRRRANASLATRHQVADGDLEAALAAHEPTADDEPRVLLDGDDGIDAWVAAVRAASRA